MEHDEKRRQLQPIPDFTLGFSRRMRRALQHNGRYRPITRDVVSLTPEAQLLDQDDDVAFYQEELLRCDAAQQQARRVLRFLDDRQRVWVLEPYLRALIDRQSPAEALHSSSQRALTMPEKEQRRLARETLAFMRSMETLYQDEDEAAFLFSFRGAHDVPVPLILEESIRLRQERMDLMRMQLDWLKDQAARAPTEPRPPASATPISDDGSGSPPAALPESQPRAYELAEWHLYWTSRMWSRNPNHLLRIPTQSRAVAVAALAAVARGQISVKPESIVKAIEFHLQKDVIQKALTIHDKYGPAHVRDWIKLKRGDDRIPILVPHADEQMVIFFAAGRDVVYRDF